MMAVIVDIIASVAPQQTGTCRSATTSTPYRRMNDCAIASRSGRAPHVTAYWLTSALMAAHAASLTAAGAAKSGNPCDRFTPPCFSLSRVISRMTDSVNCRALRDPVSLDMVGMESGSGAPLADRPRRGRLLRRGGFLHRTLRRHVGHRFARARHGDLVVVG